MSGASLKKISRLVRYRKIEAAVLRLLPKLFGRKMSRFLLRSSVSRCINQPMPPVLIYTMMKVASTAVSEALRPIEGLNIFHVHSISPARTRRVREEVRRRGLTSVKKGLDNHEDFAQALADGLIKPGHPAKVIALVREPIARNVSFYFQSLDDLWQTKNAHENIELERLLAEYPDRFMHERVLAWFDEEFKTVLGIDVYEQPFPREAGFQRIDSGPYEVLIMRHDLDDRVKERCLADLIGVSTVSLTPRNISAQKPYADVYREFLRRVELPADYVHRLLDSKYARHFYSPEELARIRAKWLKRSAVEESVAGSAHLARA
jgi:putative capsular polysaccharide synthesis protein